MDDVTGSDPLPLASDYTRFARRHLRGIAAASMVGVLAGLALSLGQTNTFSATASVALSPVPVYVMSSVSELAPPPVSIDTDAQLLRSTPVLAAVGRELDTDPALVEQHMSVTASANTSILHVTVSASDPRAAARAADAAAQTLIDVRRSSLGAITHEQIRQLRFQVIAQEGALAREQSRRLVVTATDDLFTSLLELRTRLAELKDARRVPAEIVGPGPALGVADYANTEVPMTSGAALGLLLGCLVGVVRDRSRGDSLVVPEESAHV